MKSTQLGYKPEQCRCGFAIDHTIITYGGESVQAPILMVAPVILKSHAKWHSLYNYACWAGNLFKWGLLKHGMWIHILDVQAPWLCGSCLPRMLES